MRTGEPENWENWENWETIPGDADMVITLGAAYGREDLAPP